MARSILAGVPILELKKVVRQETGLVSLSYASKRGAPFSVAGSVCQKTRFGGCG